MHTQPDVVHFVVIGRDAVDSAPRRRASLDEHRAYVDGLAEQIVLSGPLLADDATTRVGQIFVLQVDDRAVAERFVAQDPFSLAGVFADVQIYRFSPKFESGRRR